MHAAQHRAFEHRAAVGPSQVSTVHVKSRPEVDASVSTLRACHAPGPPTSPHCSASSTPSARRSWPPAASGVPFHPAPSSVDFDGNIAVAQLGNAGLGVLSLLVALAFVQRWGRHVPRWLLAVGAGTALLSGLAGAIVVATSLTGLREDHGQWGIDSLVLGVAPLGAWLLLTIAAVREWHAGRSPSRPAALAAVSSGPRHAGRRRGLVAPRHSGRQRGLVAPRHSGRRRGLVAPRHPGRHGGLAAPRHPGRARPSPARGRRTLRSRAPWPPRRVRRRRGLRRLRRPQAALGARRRVAPAPGAAPPGRAAGHARPRRRERRESLGDGRARARRGRARGRDRARSACPARARRGRSRRCSRC